MSEPQAGTQNRFWMWVERIGWLLGVIAALVAVLLFFQEYQFVERDRYAELVDVEARYNRGELIAPKDCPKQECPPPPSGPKNPGVDQVTILTNALDELIEEAGFLARHIGKPDFFGRFDRWRAQARDKLTDGQKLIKDAGWTGNEDWVGTFRAQTHIHRDVAREPYRPEEYRRFLEAGSQVLRGMKREVLLHSGKGTAPAGSSGPPSGDS